MTLYAQTEIRFGQDDGSVKVIAEGEKVSGLPDEVLEQMKESGSVAETKPFYGAEQLEREHAETLDRVAELEAALAEARGKEGANEGTVKPAGGQQAAADSKK